MHSDPIAQIAARHGFSAEAARSLLGALHSTGGSLAQFNHPELGGMGQWMPGMIMIGDMFNNALKARVDALCTELAGLVANPAALAAALGTSGSGTGETGTPMEPMKPMEPLRGMEPWWPKDLGQPNTTGGQDDVRYAYFADRRRLAVSRGGKVTVYDTADHQIGGVSQQQGGGRSDVVFTSQHGPVALADLKVVGP